MFIVISASRLPPHLKGYVTRFLAQIDTGVFVGRTSKRVADRLWDRISSALESGSAVMVVSDNTQEQGFTIRTCGVEGRRPVDIDGMWLANRRGTVDFATKGR